MKGRKVIGHEITEILKKILVRIGIIETNFLVGIRIIQTWTKQAKY